MERHESLSPPPLKKRKVDETTGVKAISSFFTPQSQQAPDPIKWRVVHESLLICNYRPPLLDKKSSDLSTRRRKIAAFDLDSTLIKSKSGKVFASEPSDWTWWHASVPPALRQLHADGYQIVVITNQGRISLQPNPKTPKADQRSLSNFKAKVSAVLKHFDFRVDVFAATSRDIFRKPRAGMWAEIVEDLDLDDEEGPDLEATFFVGDAGGRAAAKDRKADHACSDRDFAANVGIKFHTPEEYFLKEEVQPFTREFEPKDYLSSTPSSLESGPLLFEKKHAIDVVLICGSPGSGKSTFYWTKLKPLGYERVNQDILKSRDKCVKVASSLLDAKQAVAVDNTNADPETRAVWVKLAKTFNVPIRCVQFTAPVKLCEHNDTVRALNDTNDHFNPEKRVILPHSAFHSFRARFKDPRIEEGFEDIVKIDFQFQGDGEAKRLWSRYWV